MLLRLRGPVLALAALATATIAAACADDASMSATGPSALSSGSAGAVISGQVVGATAVSPGRTSASGAFTTLAEQALTVRVMGTDIATTVNGQGRFTLTGVPGGTIQLQFTGPGTNATVTLAGVSPSDRIEITVQVNGNNARLDSERRGNNGNGVQVNGRISSRDMSARLIVVNGTTVSVPAGTTIRHGNRTFDLGDLHVGDHVQVKGTWVGNTLVASEVKVESEGEDDDDDDDGREAELKGAISGLSNVNGCPSVTFVVQSTRVRTNSGTTFRDVSCSGLSNGRIVEVEGTKQSDGWVLARRVELDD